MKRVCRWRALALTAILFAGPVAAAESAENPYAEAELSFSSDPTAMVLHVRYGGGLGGTFKSMSLFGDGRLVLKSGRRGKVQEEHSSQISFDESSRLVRLATDHGLAEWDGTAFEAKALEVTGGSPLENWEVLFVGDFETGTTTWWDDVVQ